MRSPICVGKLPVSPGLTDSSLTNNKKTKSETKRWKRSIDGAVRNTTSHCWRDLSLSHILQVSFYGGELDGVCSPSMSNIFRLPLEREPRSRVRKKAFWDGLSQFNHNHPRDRLCQISKSTTFQRFRWMKNLLVPCDRDFCCC